MIRRLVFILFSTSELGVTFVVCRGLGTQKPTINGEPVIAKMPTYSAKTNVQRLTGQPLAYAPKPVHVQRNNAENHQPPLSRMDVFGPEIASVPE
jgi:hypothetical protein